MRINHPIPEQIGKLGPVSVIERHTVELANVGIVRRRRLRRFLRNR